MDQYFPESPEVPEADGLGLKVPAADTVKSLPLLLGDDYVLGSVTSFCHQISYKFYQIWLQNH